MDYDRTTMPESYDLGRKQPDGVLEMWMDRTEVAVGCKVSSITDAFTHNGFNLSCHETVPHKMAENVADLAHKASFRADSTLIRLSDADFERGLACMRATASTHSVPAMIDIDLFVFTRC